MLYQAYELAHAFVSPYRAFAIAGKKLLKSPFNFLSQTPGGEAFAAALDVFESVTRRYEKPEWGLENPQVAKGVRAPLKIESVWSKPFCNLLHFNRDMSLAKNRVDPKVLVVAPMSGHYATLLRGTVEALIEDHDVYITDWIDARQVPLSKGRFGLDDYIAYIRDIIRFLGEDVHVIAVCQPGPPVLAAISIMSDDNEACVPATMTYMGSPIDPRRSPTAPNRLATEKPIEWFQNNVINMVPPPYAGLMRRVYPGFLQLTGFMTMNLERHYKAHMELFQNLVINDGDSVDKHRTFYDEYLAVMDLTEEFYLETIEKVFQNAELPRGKLRFKGRRVDPTEIRRTALLTVEGGNDDISGVGQTQAAHDLCSNIPATRKKQYLHPDVGHYGVFNGSRWRKEIKPVIAEFIRKNPKPAPLKLN